MDPSLVGRQIGVYRVDALLGAGGMAVVYRARDTRLGRDVAIKILPDLFTDDPERLSRFEREARVLASLNHPHIGAIHGIEESDGVKALVLELVEGETLATRLERGALTVPESLTVARQIADALEAAHEKGIVHRDLKPANIILQGPWSSPPRSARHSPHVGETPHARAPQPPVPSVDSSLRVSDIRIKVLDFGIAKLDIRTAAGSDPSHMPTVTDAGTREGLVIGTAAYMSPEQTRGQALDKCTDIWAFGCVFYEMLTARTAFGGDTVSDTIVRVLEREPDWDALPPNVPADIRRLLRRCLEKDPNRRLHDIADARIEIDDAIADSGRSETAQASSGMTRPRQWGAILAAVAVGAAVAAAAAIVLRPTPPDRQEIRLDVTTAGTTDPASFALSPDGRHIVYVAAGDGTQRLWLRSFDTTAARPLAGTEDASYPFWSPDSKSVAFFSAFTRLRRVEIAGGVPQVLTNTAPGVGGAWGPGGVILFARSLSSGIYRVPASGGEVQAVTKLDAPRQITHAFPQFLPGGRRFLFYVLGAEDVRGIYAGSLDSDETTRLTAADTAGAYVSPGWLLFVRHGTLFAQRFDPERLALGGDPVTIADSVDVPPLPGAGAFASSAAGLVAYRETRASPRQLTWFDRAGKMLGTLGPVDGGNLVNPRIAPDGRRVAVERTLENNVDLWLLDPPRVTRVTSEPGQEQFPVWSPDGTGLAFVSDRAGGRDIYMKPLDPAGPEQLVFASPGRKVINDWSPDGRFMLYHEPDPKTGPDLWVQSLDGGRPVIPEGSKPVAFLDTSFVEVWGEFSPDGRLVAYQSNESGPAEIYVRRFPGTSDQWQVSTSGGVYCRWAPDGKELYFVEPGGSIMGASIDVTATKVSVGAPKALFKPRMLGRGGNFIGWRQQYDVAPDGRFLVNVETEETSTAPITVILNWQGPPEPR